MTSARIDYGNLMQRAMRRLVAEVIERVAEEGLPGAHHFYIGFDTRHPDVRMSDWLRELYPEDMTIVLQHWFADLAPDERGFSVTLNFGDRPENLYIPYEAIVTFVDPSVEFGLRFDSADNLASADAAPEDAAEEPAAAPTGEDEAEKAAPADAEIVSLDKFRKQ